MSSLSALAGYGAEDDDSSNSSASDSEGGHDMYSAISGTNISLRYAHTPSSANRKRKHVSWAQGSDLTKVHFFHSTDASSGPTSNLRSFSAQSLFSSLVGKNSTQTAKRSKSKSNSDSNTHMPSRSLINGLTNEYVVNAHFSQLPSADRKRGATNASLSSFMSSQAAVTSTVLQDTRQTDKRDTTALHQPPTIKQLAASPMHAAEDIAFNAVPDSGETPFKPAITGVNTTDMVVNELDPPADSEIPLEFFCDECDATIKEGSVRYDCNKCQYCFCVCTMCYKVAHKLHPHRLIPNVSIRHLTD